MAKKKPIDIVDVKAGVRDGKICVRIENNRILLGDLQTGESIRLSDIEVKPVVHARWIDLCESYSDIPAGRCSNCGVEVVGVDGDVNYCFSCGARMDGETQ